MSIQVDDAIRLRCQQIIAESANQALTVAQTRHVNEELGHELAHVVLSSASLQEKAVVKLGDGLWWATDKSLQQSTPWQVAQRKAGWFGDGAVYDLCCGMGGDAIQLAGASDATNREVVAVDLSDEACLIARENLANHCGNNTSVVQGDVTSQVIPDGAWVHVDPDRRDGDRRSVDPHQYSPAWDDVTQILTKVRGGLVKLAPAAEPLPIDRTDIHRVWISLAGVVREQSLLVGEVASRYHNDVARADHRSERSVVLLNRQAELTCYYPASHDPAGVPIRSPEPVGLMVDPDAAIRSAGLTESFASELGLGLLGGPSGFLTGDVDADQLAGLAVAERILWQGSCDDRRLRRELRARDRFPWRIKTRGVSHDPNQLEKKLKDCGDQPCTLWMGRNGKRHYAVMTEAL